MKTFFKDKGYLFSVLIIMLGFGLCCCVLGAIKAIALGISQNLGFDALLNAYTKINGFIHNGRSAFGYIFNILSSVIAIILCAVAGHLWLRDFSKKEIAGACTIYNIYTILTLLITLFLLVIFTHIIPPFTQIS